MTLSDGWLLPWLLPVFGLWLVAWALLPALAARRHGGSPATVRYSSLIHLKRLRASRSVLLRRLVRGTRVVTIALLLLAMTRPQTGRKLTDVVTEGVDIVLVVDTSGSMRALDLDADRPIRLRRNRLQVAQAVVETFVAQRENDQIGLVVFGDQAFTQCPLTLDHGIVASFLERLEVGMAGDATALGSALGTAVKRLRDSPAKSKVVVLLTDGRSNAGMLSPLQAAEIAAAFEVKVYTVGVGGRGPAPFLVDTPLGRRVEAQDVEIDEETLLEIAELTGGEYFRAEDTEGLAAIYERIDELETTEVKTTSYMEYEERFPWFVAPALLLLLGEVLLLGTRFRKLP